MTEVTVKIAGHAGPEERRTYRMIPFAVPPGTRRVAVSYVYSDIGSPPGARRASIVDIGLFDAGGVDAAGFRGWSGSARPALVITEGAATPGYRAGALPPGTWHVALGLYEIAPSGCAYEITVALADVRGMPQVAVDAETPLDALPGPHTVALPGWLRGDLHCHTHHSDGDATAAGVLATARALGLDFLAVTDHNTISHHDALRLLNPRGLILIPGVEVTTYFGHANVWGLPGEYVEFRCRTPDEMMTSLASAVERGGIASMNHPKPHGPPWEFGPLAPLSCVEVWNGPWPAHNADALAHADALLRAGRRLIFVGGSDMHHYAPPRIPRLGHPTTWLHAPGAATASALLAALRLGHTFISRDPRGPQLVLASGDGEGMMGDTIPRPPGGRVSVRIHARGAADMAVQLATERGIVGTLHLATGDARYTAVADLGDAWTLRAQIVDARHPYPPELLAITTPLFFA